MNKIFQAKTGFLTACLTFALLLGSVHAERMINVTVDGRLLALAQPPMMIAGRVMVPLRGVFENLYAHVDYNAADHSITATRGNIKVVLWVGSAQAIVNGQTQTLDVAPRMIGSLVYIPLRFVSEALQADVHWEAYDSTVAIMSRTGGANLPLPVEPSVQPPVEPPTAYPSGEISIDLLGPAPAAKVPAQFDVTGQTAPYSTVRFRLIGGKTDVVNTQATANASGFFRIPVDLSTLGSGTHIIMYLQAEDTTGRLSQELRVELQRL